MCVTCVFIYSQVSLNRILNYSQLTCKITGEKIRSMPSCQSRSTVLEPYIFCLVVWIITPGTLTNPLKKDFIRIKKGSTSDKCSPENQSINQLIFNQSYFKNILWLFWLMALTAIVDIPLRNTIDQKMTKTSPIWIITRFTQFPLPPVSFNLHWNHGKFIMPDTGCQSPQIGI